MNRVTLFLVGIAVILTAIIFSLMPATFVSRAQAPQTPWIVTATPGGATATPQIMPYGWTPSPAPVATPNTPTAQTVAIARKAELFQSPVQATSWFNDESKWLIAEPGVLLDASTAWTIPGTDQTYSVNVPEGGFTYISCGGCNIALDSVTISLPFEKGLNHLILLRGRNDDGIVDSDLNITAKVSGFKPGHAIWSHMPTGAYVSKDWFQQQLVASTTKGYTNCGATGCSRVRIVLFDVDSHFFQEFETRAGAIDTWTLIASN